MWFRRRRPVVPSVPHVEQDEGVRILPAAGTALVASPPAMRVERYVAALAFHNAQLEDRIGQLERQAAAREDEHLDLPSNADLLDVRLHTARVSADLGRLALELRTEVAEIKDEADRSAKPPVRAAVAAERAQDPEQLVQLAEELLELADELDARRRAS